MALDTTQTGQLDSVLQGYGFTANSPTVVVRLEVVNEDEAGESHTFRYLTLEAPSYSVHIGRGSRSGSKDLYPAENNAWFDSRVMSRDHAILKAQLGTKTLTIEDVGSMHGTYLDDVKLSKFQPQVVHDGDAIVFGAEVSRGPGKNFNHMFSIFPEYCTKRHLRNLPCS